MTVLDKLRENAMPRPVASTEKSWERGTTRAVKTHHVQALLGKHLDPKSWDDPRSQMVLSRVLIYCFPFLRKALVLHSAFLGNIRIVAEDENLKESLEQFIDTVPIVSQQNPEWRQHYFGLNNFVKMLLATALEDGLSFAEEVYDDENGPLVALMPIPSEKFDFVKKAWRGADASAEEGAKSILVYTSYTGKQTEVEPSEHFYLFGVRFKPGSMWGLQMTDGGQFFGEFLVRILVSRMKLHSRFGNPPSIDTFILKDPEKLVESDILRFIAEADSVHEDLVAAQQAGEQGKSAAVVAKMVGNVEHKHEMYGTDAVKSTDFIAEYEAIAKQLALVTDMPPEFLGFDTTGGGLGDAKFNVLNGIVGSITEVHRELLAPIIRRILRNYLISINAPISWIEGFQIDWDELDTNDAKIMAETALKEAEAIAKHFDNIMTMVSNGLASEEKIQDYADEHGLNIDLPDLKVAPDPPLPPMPPQA